MASTTDLDTTIACGLCASLFPLEDYSKDNPFYCGILFCDSCILELYNHLDVDYDGWETTNYYGVPSTKSECESQEVKFEPDEEQEEAELEILKDEWRCEYHDESEGSFDYYDHFGIPCDLSESEQDALLEAAMGSS